MLWVYKELSQEVKQIKQLQSAALASNSCASQQCQLTLLQAEAYQRLAQQPNSTESSAAVDLDSLLTELMCLLIARFALDKVGLRQLHCSWMCQRLA